MAIEEKYRYWKERIDVPGQGGKSLFGWLLEQDLSDLHDLLAFCTAVSVNTVSGTSGEVARLITPLNLAMADWWEATSENYLSHVSKDRILSVVTGAVSLTRQAETMRNFKKDQLVQKADEELSEVVAG